MGVKSVVVRSRCVHGDTHPHSYIALPSGESKWCADGDHRALHPEDLTVMLLDVLTDATPRVATTDAAVKVRQLVDRIFEEVR